MRTIRHLAADEVRAKHWGKRVRVLWNPEVRLWYIYNTTGEILFTTFRLELHTVSVFGEIKPKYAPEGTPGFVGTIVAMEEIDEKQAIRVRAHPYAPAKLFFEEFNGPVYTYEFSRRILLDRGKMYASGLPKGTQCHVP